MLGFLIGTACLIGLIKVLRWGRRGYGGCGGYGYGGGCGSSYGGGCGGGYDRRRWGWGGHHGHDAWEDHDHGFGGWGGGPTVFLRGLFRELGTTPGQEKVILQAVEEVREAAKNARGELKSSRADVAKAVRATSFDEVLFGEMFARHDAALESIRKATVGAMAKVHDALDEKQRARLAEILENGPGFFGRRWAERSYPV